MNNWNDLTLQPIGGEDYLLEDVARDRYESDSHFFEVVPEPGDSGVPAWSMHFYPGKAGAFKFKFYDRHGSIIRIVRFDAIDGRFFRSKVIDYSYPGDSLKRWGQSESVYMVTGLSKSDGTATVITNDNRTKPGLETVAKYRNVPTESFWVDRPTFGEWNALADADIAELATGVGVADFGGELVDSDRRPGFSPGAAPSVQLAESVAMAEYGVAKAVFEAAKDISGWERVVLRADVDGNLSAECRAEDDSVVGQLTLSDDVTTAVIRLGLTAAADGVTWSAMVVTLNVDGNYHVDFKTGE
ncbi:hypothetical protein, partial [Gordonia effusa]